MHNSLFLALRGNFQVKNILSSLNETPLHPYLPYIRNVRVHASTESMWGVNAIVLLNTFYMRLLARVRPALPAGFAGSNVPRLDFDRVIIHGKRKRGGNRYFYVEDGAVLTV